MILPTKHISPERSLLGLGAAIIGYLAQPRTVTELWDEVRALPQFGTFERFALSLDFLYAVGLIDIQDGVLRRAA